MADDLERQIADMLADGRMTDGDAEHVREFIDFLGAAGPPNVGEQSSPDGKQPIDRLIEAGRADLLEYALGPHNAEVAFWGHSGLDMANVIGEPPYNVVQVGIKILNTIDPLRMLDLGCGNGRLTNMIARRVTDEGVVHGVDISRRLIDLAVEDAWARNLLNANYWHGDGRHLPAGLNGKFSGAYAVTLFQHIPHDAMWGYLREVHDRLEPGGVLLFTIAVGEADEFLNHQIPDVLEFNDNLITLFDATSISQPDERGWTWVTAWKELP